MIAGGDSIQIDKGEFVRIHNTIFDLLAKAPLRGQQFRCLMFLFRKTYGFNKKEDKISLAQWAEGTGLRRQNIWRELQLLIKCNVIYAQKNGIKSAMTWGFNKHHEQWNFESVIADDYKSVITDDDKNEQSVILDDYSENESVITSDYKSVITPHENTKDNKDSSSSAAANCEQVKPSRPTKSEFVTAYERIWGLTVSSQYIGEQIQEWESKVTLDGWRYALQECADRRNVGNWKYLNRILERIERDGYQPKAKVVVPSPEVLDISVGAYL